MATATARTLLVCVTFVLVPPSLALTGSRLPSSRSSLTVGGGAIAPKPHRVSHAPRSADSVMRDEGGFSKYLSQSADAWAKAASERPLFVALRVAILLSGLYFFATLAITLVQRAL